MNNSDKVTICIPTHNSLSTIKIVLGAFKFQDVYPKIIILENGSRDGTFEALAAMIRNRWFKKLKIDLQFFGSDVTLRKHQNLNMVRHHFCQHVTTPYLMFVDSDVLVPPYCIIPMLDHLDKFPKIGMLALVCDVEAGHVQLGASVLRTELVKDLKWRRQDEECQCICAAKHLLVRGFSVENYTKTSARHLLAF